MTDSPLNAAPGPEQRLVDSVLLIDADNDPHLPPDFPISERALVRLFLRTDAKSPRALERRVASLPFCVTVRSTKGGSNASDFVMSLHAGILHATLPMHIPFTLVTADKSLSAMVQELQRLGRQAVLWTSHPETSVRRRPVPSQDSGSRRLPPVRRPRTRTRPQGGISAPVPPAPAEVAQTARPSAGKRSLAEVAAAYAARLARMKDTPSRLKALLNDIKNRASAPGFAPEAILEELKRSHGLKIDERGHVHRPDRPA